MANGRLKSVKENPTITGNLYVNEKELKDDAGLLPMKPTSVILGQFPFVLVSPVSQRLLLFYPRS